MENNLNIEQFKKMSADEAIKSAFSADDKALIKFTNSTMGKNHDVDTSVVTKLDSSFVRPVADGKIMMYDNLRADMIFKINDDIYNIEFQTTHDSTMIVRMLQYELNTILNELKSAKLDDKFETYVDIPAMSVIQLEESKNVPDHYKVHFRNTVTNKILTQEYPIVKLWEHTTAQLLAENKAMLIPFTAIKNRKILDIDKSEVGYKSTIKDIKESYNTLSELAETGEISIQAYHEYHNSTTHVAQYFLEKYFNINNPYRKELETVIAEARQEPKYRSFADLLREEVREEYRSFAELKREEGREEGIEIGIGIGKAEGAIDILLRLPKPSLDTLKSIAREYNLSDKQLATTISALEDSYKKGKAPNYKLPSEISRFCIAQRNEMMKEKPRKKSLQAEKPTTKKRGDDGR